MQFAEYQRHPAKNREDTGIPFPWIVIADASGTEYRTNPNGLVGCVIWGANGEQPSDRSGNLIDSIEDGAVVFNPLALVPRTDVLSMLSGEPSVAFRHDDIVIDLTPEELLRLIARRLHPEEYMSLRERFGMFYDLNDDFYDHRTGETYDPMEQLFGENATPAIALKPKF